MIGLWIALAVVLLFSFVVVRGAPYVPSHHRDVRRAFRKLYQVDSHDLVVDFGSGDGIILRSASACGARSVGYELNPALVAVARFLSRKDKRVQVLLRDFWLTPLPNDTTLVYGFCVSRDMKKMTNKLQAEANRLQHTIFYIGYGSELHGVKSEKSLGAHHLYRFTPLQEVVA